MCVRQTLGARMSEAKTEVYAASMPVKRRSNVLEGRR